MGRHPKPQSAEVDIMTYDEAMGQGKPQPPLPLSPNEVPTLNTQQDIILKELADVCRNVARLQSDLQSLNNALDLIGTAFDAFKEHSLERFGRLAAQVDQAQAEVPKTVYGQNLLAESASEFKDAVKLGRKAKEAFGDKNEDFNAAKIEALQAQEAYLRKATDATEIKFLNQSIASLRAMK